jgi:polyhydroxyalkanoate depolymerase
MLYETYQLQDDMMAPLRWASRMARGFVGPLALPSRRSMGAALEMISRFELSHTRPGFGIDSVRVGNRDVPVTEEVVLDLPFGKLLHFAKDVDTPQPRVLVAAPLSGHFATLLRGTVATLLRDHDVYITDWVNAREVPVSAGRFGVEDYVDYLIRFLEEIGPGAHVLAVCQPCVQALAAVAVMSRRATRRRRGR